MGLEVQKSRLFITLRHGVVEIFIQHHPAETDQRRESIAVAIAKIGFDPEQARSVIVQQHAIGQDADPRRAGQVEVVVDDAEVDAAVGEQAEETDFPIHRVIAMTDDVNFGAALQPQVGSQHVRVGRGVQQETAASVVAIHEQRAAANREIVWVAVALRAFAALRRAIAVLAAAANDVLSFVGVVG